LPRNSAPVFEKITPTDRCGKINWEAQVDYPMQNHFPGVIHLNHNQQKALNPRLSG
jgi:hypothetical protein